MKEMLEGIKQFTLNGHVCFFMSRILFLKLTDIKTTRHPKKKQFFEKLAPVRQKHFNSNFFVDFSTLSNQHFSLYNFF